MRVTIEDSCTACGLCVEVCPTVFELENDGDIARVKVDEIPTDQEDAVREAADGCPVDAIQVKD